MLQTKDKNTFAKREIYKPRIKTNMADSNAQEQPEIPMLNDDELEKILHPNNNELFPDEIITPSNNNSNTPSNIEVIPNDSNGLETGSLYNKSIALRHEPRTDIVRATNRGQVGPYETHPLLSTNGLESDTALNELFPAVSSSHSTASNGAGGMQQAIHNIPTTTNRSIPVRPLHSVKTRPAFVNKIWSMMNDTNNHEWIQWTDDGMSFIVKNRENFVHEVLPKYFKHNNFASFVRQLNMYGWHKIQDVKAGSIQASNEDKWEFENPNFIRGREDLLVNIVRQKGNSQTHAQVHGTNQNIQGQVNSGDRPMLHLMNEPSTYSAMDVRKDVSTVLNELEKIKYNQMAISKDLLRINKDNELLWKENMMARERHRTQQQTLEKIFRFLTSLVPHMDQKMLMDGIMNYSDGNGNGSENNKNKNGDNGMDMNNGNDKSRFQEEIYNNTTNQTNDNTNGVPVSPATELYNEINADGHDTYLHDTNTYNPYDYIPQRSRLLLKNRSNSSSSSNVPGVSPNTLNKDKISEIPFDEDEEDSKIKEIPHTSTSANNDGDIVSSKFLGNLQANIDEQDLRIQHLENMVEGLSPIKEVKSGKNTPGDNFSLQDYFTSDALPDDETHQPNTMTPLFYDDKTLLHVGNNDLLNSEIEEDSNKRKANEMDPSIRIEELSPEPNSKRPKFSKQE
mgnify:CR=1 FL=1